MKARPRTRTMKPRRRVPAKNGTRRKPRRSRAPAKKGTRKRKLNAFFKIMLKAKKNSDESFVYNGMTYKGKKHPKLRMIYKRA
jgi:hypothetical protein